MPKAQISIFAPMSFANSRQMAVSPGHAGAVTHVLVNDPTKGYGILIENMLDAAE